ncbi:MAG: hypothetical protein KDA61_11325 [Planctomycetales bacterium]|nr:hypothetical protein [Planctomycetales bacterium]
MPLRRCSQRCWILLVVVFALGRSHVPEATAGNIFTGYKYVKVRTYITKDNTKRLVEETKVPMEEYTVWESQQKAAGREVHITGNSDPWIAFNTQFYNSSSEEEFVFVGLEMPLSEFGVNMVSSELTIELFDTSGDGLASLTRSNPASMIVESNLAAESDNSLLGPIWGLGSQDLTAAGTYQFNMPATPGPVNSALDRLDVHSSFFLSPGDTIHLRGLVFIDDGAEGSLPAIPRLEDIPDQPFYSVINSPNWIIGDNDWLGAQTQLNVAEGGEIGDRFNFQAILDNEIQDQVFLSEVNISGGVVGRQFMALSGTTVNISGGTVGDGFLAGSYSGLSSDVVVNISGGSVSATSNSLQAYAGSTVNISGGVVGRTSASGGVVNISGGVVGRRFLTNSLEAGSDGVLNLSGGEFPTTSGIFLLSDGTANLSGGTFAAAEHQIQAVGGAKINLFGREFFLDGLKIESLAYGTSLEIVDRDVTLSGALADGSLFSIDLRSTNPFPAPGDYVDPTAVVTISLALPGDFDADGDVDGSDFLLWQRGGSPAPLSQADLSVWRANLGRVWADGDAVQNLEAVPEPTGALALASGLIAILAVRRI